MGKKKLIWNNGKQLKILVKMSPFILLIPDTILSTAVAR
jgi:hypothetical protein